MYLASNRWSSPRKATFARGNSHRRSANVTATSRSDAWTWIRGCDAGQQHVMVQRVRDRLQGVAKGDEIHHVVVLVRRSLHFGPHAIVVAMQGLANVPAVRDEVPHA